MLRILTYHRVADPAATPGLDPALVSATPDTFRAQMRYLARHRRVVSLDRVLEAFGGGRALPSRSVLLTFDDAYRDVGEVAWPVLRALGLPAAVFVPTAFPGRPERAFWWDRLHRAGCDRPELARSLKASPPDEALERVERICAAAGREHAAREPGPPPERPPVLDWDELRTLQDQGLRLGSHTRTHASLAAASERRIREELRASMSDLTEHVGPCPRTICYPYGFHDDRVVRIAREEGFELGFTNIDGRNRPDRMDPLRLRRTNITRRTSPLLFRLRMQPWFVPVDRWRHRHERARATSGATPGRVGGAAAGAAAGSDSSVASGGAGR